MGSNAVGRSRYRIYDLSAPHFLTCTVVEWLPVFAQPANAQLLLDSLQFLQNQNRLVLYGYVILENHCHLLASSSDLPQAIASFKSYTAARIIARMKEKQTSSLRLLSLHKAQHRVDRDYQLWQEGAHPKQVQNREMMEQKLNYIHNNPVARGYVDDPLHWRYSSARNYGGQDELIAVSTDW